MFQKSSYFQKKENNWNLKQIPTHENGGLQSHQKGVGVMEYFFIEDFQLLLLTTMIL